MSVVAVVSEVEPGSELQQVRDQLPAEFDALFELTEAEAVDSD
jgi:hypothetical protein